MSVRTFSDVGGVGDVGASSDVETVVVTYFPWENTRYLEYSSSSVRAKFEMNGAGISVTTTSPDAPDAPAENAPAQEEHPVIASFIDAFVAAGFRVYST